MSISARSQHSRTASLKRWKTLYHRQRRKALKKKFDEAISEEGEIDFLELLAIAIVDYGMESDRFWDMTFAQFAACAARIEQRSLVEDHRAGVLATVIARTAGAKNVKPSSFFPSLKSVPGGSNKKMSVEDQLKFLTSIFPSGAPHANH